MEEAALRFFRSFEVWVYLILGLGGLYFVRKFLVAWQELRGAVFGLERNRAQERLNQAAGILVILLTMAVGEFLLVYFVAPTVPGALPLPTPTLNLLASPTITLPATTPQSGSVGTLVENSALAPPSQNGCIPGQIEVTFPKDGQEVSGVVEVLGSVDIPNFGFYKFEIKRPDETVWLTIQAGNTVVKVGWLGDWDTGRLTPGEYQLGLVAVDNQAQAYLPCIIRVRVAAAPEATRSP